MSATATLASIILTGPDKGLVRTVFGEYTAASVAADPLDAGRLSLVRQDDGNYGLPAFAVGGPALSRSSRFVQSAVINLAVGG